VSRTWLRPTRWAALAVALGCGDDPSSSARNAVAAAQAAASAQTARAVEAVDAAAKSTRDAAASLWPDVPDTGALSRTALRYLASASDGAAGLVAVGAQLAPVAQRIAQGLDAVVDRELQLEPIVQKLDDPAARAKVDAAIGDMPHHTVVDGVQIGLRDLGGIEGDAHVRERGVLVLWRTEDRMLGFVVRSRRSIDIPTLIREVPVWFRITSEALG
jgi:hypothetical protein